MKKPQKKIISVLLSAVLMITVCNPAFAGAAEKKKSSEKEETIYATLASDGSLKSMYAVNSFNGGNITDYGNYENVKMLNTEDPIKQNGDTVTFSSSAEKVYYQGDLENRPLPWNISIQYLLDGKKYTADEIAGKSGHLEVRFKVEKNEDCTGSFYDNYALQASFTLDTEQCSDISAPDATIANAGGSKQLTYTILPGKGIDTSFYADVKDFEMESASINGIHLNLNADVDDSALTEKVGELINAVSSLNKGAAQLSDGTAAVEEGASKTEQGALALKNGASSLSGISELKNASSQIRSGIDDAYNGSLMFSQNFGYAQYKNVMSDYGIDVDSLRSENEQMISDLNQQIEILKQAPEQSESVQNQIQLLQEAAALLEKNNGASSGTENYITNISGQLSPLTENMKLLKTKYETFDDSLSQLSEGAEKLTSGTEELYQGTAALRSSISSLHDGSQKMAEGTDSLYRETADSEAQIKEKIDDILQSINGSMEDPASFVSEKNTNVKSVQFVIKTDPVEINEKQPAEEKPKEESSLWEKFLDLFK
ncbi:MAG: hypothetical protein ACLU5E_00540 [Anaerovoracaceae bacterium]